MADDVQYDPYEDFEKHPGKEAFTRLCRAEWNFRVPPKYLFAAGKVDPRTAAVHLIETIYPRTTHAFDHLIPYTAVTYFDRFYAIHDDFPSVLQTSDVTRNRELFAICCLTISWKLRDKSFFLTEFLRKKNLLYSVENVREMELHICRGLEWRLRTVTPFLFAGFFTPYLQNYPLARPIFHDLIYVSQRDIEFTAYTASTIALSALLVVTSFMASISHSKFVLNLITSEVHHYNPLLDVVEKCRARLAPMCPPRFDDPPPRPAPGSGPSSVQSTSLAPGQTSTPIDDPPAGAATGTGPSSAPGQTSSGSGGSPPAAAADRPRQRPGKEHVTDSGQLQLGGHQDADPNAVTNKAADVDTSDQASVQDAGDIQLVVANQDDQVNQNTGQVGDDVEAEDREENKLTVADERSGRTSFAQKLHACCTIL